MTKPFLKWAGGKTQLLKQMTKYFPNFGFERYVEPFLGGGSVYFFLRPDNALLSDSNNELINTFKVVKTDPERLIDSLKVHENKRSYFETLRNQDPVDLTDLERSSRFIYLNKTCFNGLYRVNAQNKFNVPFADYYNPNICDELTIRICSKILNKPGIEICSTYFENILSKCSSKDFIYLDPPYYPVKENSFTDYTKKGFGEDDHERLAKHFEELSNKGAKVLLSNSDCDWVRNRYKKFEMIEMFGKRSINSKGNGRGKVSELLIKNY